MMRSISFPHIRSVDQEREWTSHKTRNHAISILRGVFDHAIDGEILEVNPATKLKRGKAQKPPVDPFEIDEKEAILSHLEGQYLLFYTLAFETGCRTGEVVGLRWSDVKGDVLLVERSAYRGETATTKTHQAREVYLSPRAKRILKANRKKHPAKQPIFITKDGAMYQGTKQFVEAFQQACEDAGVRYRRPYNCRHTYASLALTDGVKPAFIARQLGDLIDTVLKNYAKWLGGDADKLELAKMKGWE